MLFRYVRIDRLPRESADLALTVPAGDEGAEFEQSALDALYTATGGYPSPGTPQSPAPTRAEALPPSTTAEPVRAEQYPPAIYGEDSLIRVKVRSVAMLNEATAQVRFTRTLEQPGLQPVVRAFVATVGFAFRPRTERTLEAVLAQKLRRHPTTE